VLKKLLLLVLACSLFASAGAQPVITFTIANPTGLTVCGSARSVNVLVKNTSATDTLKNAHFIYRMPTGLSYQKGSLTGTGDSEYNVTDLSQPVFAFRTLAPGDSAYISFNIIADCRIITFIDNGGTMKTLARMNFTGAADSAYSSTFSVLAPSINISSITNQSYDGIASDTFSRRIFITNGAAAPLGNFTLYIIPGKDVTVKSLGSKSYSTSNDTIKVNFTGLDFQSVGNKDAYLDKDETVIVQEYDSVLSCTDLGTQYIAWWGCSDSICDSYTTNGNVVIKPLFPDLKASGTGFLSQCVSPSTGDLQQIVITNMGDGPAFNVKVAMSLPNGTHSRMDKSSFTLSNGFSGSVSVIPDSVAYSTSMTCGDSTSTVSGFGYIIPRIDASQSVTLSWKDYSCCVGEGTLNGWSGSISYTDQCRKKVYSPVLIATREYIQNLPAFTVNTTNILVKDSTLLDFQFDGPASFIQPGASSELKLQMKVPPGLIIDKSSIRYQDNGYLHTYRVDSVVTSGSYVNAYFRVISTDFSYGHVMFNVTADTTGGIAHCDDQLYLPISATYLTGRGCSCSPVMWEDSFPLLINCINPTQIGMYNDSFGVIRTNYGLPDNDDDGIPDASGSLDFTKVKTGQVMYNDTFEVSFKGHILTDTSVSQWDYGFAEINFSSDYFTHLSFDITIKDSLGNIYTCNKMPSYTKVKGLYRYSIGASDLITAGCSIPSGFHYQKGDSVFIKIKYKVTTNTSSTSNVRITDYFFMSKSANPTSISEYYFVHRYTTEIAVVGYYFASSSYSYNFSGCNSPTVLSTYYSSIGACCSNYQGGDIFRYEYRNWSHISRMKVVLPVGYTYNSARFYYYPTQGLFKSGNYSFNISPYYQNGDTLYFRVDSLFKPNGGTLIYSDDGYSGSIAFNVTPSCQVPKGVFVPFTVVHYFEQEDALGGGEYVTNGGLSVKWVAPNITIQPALNPVNTVADTFSWQVYISNLYGADGIGKPWLAFTNNSGKISVTGLTYTNTNTAIPATNGIYRLDSLAGATTQLITVKAKMSNCLQDSVRLIMGWDCHGYPTDISSYTCPVLTKSLLAKPQKPLIQVNTLSAPDTLDLCDTATYTIELKNTKTGTAYDAELNVNLLPGMTLVPGSSSLEYPADSGFQNVSDPSVNGFQYTYKAASLNNSIKNSGVSGILIPTRNSVRIRFKVITDCDYISGSFFNLVGRSYDICGKEINRSQGVTPSLYLRGAVATYSTSIALQGKGVNGCAHSNNTTVKIVNNGPDKTDSGDFVYVTLPDGVHLGNQHITAGHNSPYDTSRVSAIFSGQLRYGWRMPPGIKAGDSMIFGVQLYGDTSLSCGTVPLLVQTTVLRKLTCVSSGHTCNIKVQSGRYYQDIPVNKPEIAITSLAANATPYDNTSEQFTVSATVLNSGDTLYPGNGQIIKYYIDKDKDGQLSSADTFIYADTLKSLMAPGTSANLTKTFLMKAGNDCQLLAYWDSAGSNCSCAPVLAGSVSVSLQNAGRDTFACPGQQPLLGAPGISGYTYQWTPASSVSDALSADPYFTGENLGTVIDSQQMVLKTTRPGGCSSYDTVQVKLYPKYVLSPGISREVCAGDTVTLGGSPTASGGTGTYRYLWRPGSGLSDSTAANPTFIANQTTTYKVYLFTGACSGLDSVTITVNQRPVADAGPDQAICNTDSVTIGGSSPASGGIGPYTYLWSPSTGLSSVVSANPNASPSTTTTYILKVTDAKGCTGYDTMVLTVHNKPVITAGTQDTICPGSSFQLGGSPTVSSGNSPYKYQWTPSAGLSGDTIANPVASPSASTIYHLTVTDKFGCQSRDSVIIGVRPVMTIDAGSNRMICYGDKTQLGSTPTASGGGSNYTYLWTPSYNINSTTSANPVVSPVTTTTYYLTVTDKFGCTKSDSVIITVNPQLQISLQTKDSICDGDTMKLSAVSGGSYTYSWSPGARLSDLTKLNPLAWPNRDTWYLLTSTDSKGCKRYDSIFVHVRTSTPLAPPVLHCVTAVDDTTLRISWTPAPANYRFSYYTVYKVDPTGKRTVLYKSANRLNSSFDYSPVDVKNSSVRFAVSVTNNCNREGVMSDTLGNIILNDSMSSDKQKALYWTTAFTGNRKYVVSAQQGGSWQDIDSITASSYLYTLCQFNGKIRVGYRDKSGCEGWSNVLTRIWKDTTAPEAPAMDYSTVLSGTSVKLRWEFTTSKDVKDYEIQYQSARGPWTKAGVVHLQDSFIVSGLNTLDSIYRFRVFALDTCASNRSRGNAVHSPIQLTGKPQDNADSLTWKAYEGFTVKSYTVYRWKNGSWQALKTLDGSTTKFLDTGLQCNVPFSYRISALDQTGNFISWSDSLTLTPFDTIQPPMPSIIFASVLNGNSIRLQWNKSVPDVRLYEVSYKTSQGSWSVYGILKDSLQTIIKGLNTLDSTYSFRIVAIDSCAANRSPSSLPHTDIQLDGKGQELSNLLTWSSYQGFSVKQYTIYHWQNNAWQKIDSVNGSVNRYVHQPLSCNITHYYKVAALSSAGNLLSYSDSIALTPFDTVPPPRPSVIVASVINDNSIRLNWNKSVPDVRLYEVSYKSEHGSWTVVSTLKDSLQTIITGLKTTDSTYSFRVVAIDSCAANRSPNSLPHTVIQLDGKGQELSNLLTWSPYIGFTVKQYNIYHLKNNTWQKIDSVDGSTYTYLHQPLQCNVTQYYKVGAISDAGNIMSYSDTIGLTPFDTVPPPAPTIVVASVISGNTIQLKWNKSVPDVRLYEVSYKSAKGPWTVYSIYKDSLQASIKGLQTTDSTYSFRIIAIDSCASNHSPYSLPHTVVQLDGKGQELSNLLTWTSYQGFHVSQYNIYQWKAGWQKIDSVDGTTYSYIHKPLPCNVTQYYKVGALNNAGNLLSYSDSIALTPFDTIKPPKPTLRYATVLPNQNVKVGWIWDTKSDVKYFELWRISNGIASYVMTTIYDSVAVDKTADVQNASNSYYIIAVDSCNTANRSVPSDTATLGHVSLYSRACVPDIRVSWKPYLHSPVRLYNFTIERSDDDGATFRSLGMYSYVYSSIEDTSVKENVIYSYRIRYDNYLTGEWSYSDTTRLMPWVYPQPDTSNTIYTTITQTGQDMGAIFIQWHKYDNLTDSFARGYRIYHSYTGNSGTYREIYETADFSDTSYAYSNQNTLDTLHYFKVVVFNLCNKEGQAMVQRPIRLTLSNQNLKMALRWSTYLGDSVKEYRVFRSLNNAAPVYFASTRDTFFSDTTVRCHNHYNYLIAGILKKGETTNSDTVGATAFDTLPPARPRVYSVSVDATDTSGSTTIIFNGISKLSRSGYQIYRSRGILYTLIANLNDTAQSALSVIDTPVNTVKGPVTYVVNAYDSCGNMSLQGYPNTTVYLKAQAHSQYIQTDWTDYRGWKHIQSYALEKRIPGQIWTTVATFDSTVHSYKDSAVKCHVYYEYRIMANGADSGEISRSNTAGDTAFELVPPKEPEISYVTVLSNGSVEIVWKHSTSPDRKEYHIYRSSTNGNNYLGVKGAFSGTTAIDIADSHDSAYTYTIETEDSCGNISTYKSLPHTTIHLSATPGNENILLNWNSYGGWPVKKYFIERNGIIIDTASGMSNSYIDTLVLCSEKYSYRVIAEDESISNIQSSSNLTDSITPHDFNPPHSARMIRATVQMPNKDVYLQWHASSSWDTKGYRIWKNDSRSSQFDVAAVINAGDTEYTDRNIQQGVPYCYYIEAFDHCDNKAIWSNAGCIMMLNGQVYNNTNLIQWNPYRDWINGVNYYDVYRNTDSSGWQKIGTASTPLFEDKDTSVAGDVKDFCYRVVAVQKGGDTAHSYSTVMCLYKDPVVFMPNIFTPNRSENLNDLFGPVGSYIGSYDMRIYNRWGEEIYNHMDSHGWDGKYNGQHVQSGVYLYIITIHSLNGATQVLKGNVTIAE
jgi:gliding motility-associated-like protein